MILDLVFAVLMGFFVGANIVILCAQIAEEDYRHAIFTFVVLVLCSLSLVMNTVSVARALKYPKIQSSEKPYMDSTFTMHGKDTTKVNYLFDFSQSTEAVKHID